MQTQGNCISPESAVFLLPIIYFWATILTQGGITVQLRQNTQKQGRQLGVSAKLGSKLNYLWRSCTGELTEQNDLFRLTYALEAAKYMHWNYRLLSDREWSGRNAVALNAGVNGIYLSRANLDVAFDDSGRQINPLTARLTGNVAGGNEAV